jgi:TRAP-type C4-dicarboxylate transport system substrate-binding protein
VLTVITADPGQGNRTVFADAVRRLSRGTLTVAYERQDMPDSARSAERAAIERVERGDVPMAWLASRVWEQEGVSSFKALWAPFLIDTHELLWKVATSPIAAEMLRGIEARGVVGLAVVPGDLRRFLGRERPLVSLGAFRGARVAAYSETAAEALRALGAIPRIDERLPGVSLAQRRIDGVEAGGVYIANNGYPLLAPYVPANVVVFPRTDVIAVNRDVFDRLTAEQRSALRGAAHAAVEAQRTLADDETRILRDVCRLGARLGVATDAQLAALATAERPVYDELARDPEVRGYLDEIQALKRGTAPEPALKIPAGCAA